NGRLGAMVFGNPVSETIQLNEESIWAGSKIKNNNTQAIKHLNELQQALFNSQYSEAGKIAGNYFVGIPSRIRSYQPLGNLLIEYKWNGEPSAYHRELDLQTGIATTSFEVNKIKYLQKVFVSAPDNVVIVQINAEKTGTINATLQLQRAIDAA